LAALTAALAARTTTSALKTVEAMAAASRPLLTWQGHLAASKTTGTADGLLAGVRPAVLEATAALALGTARFALFSMRAQIDLMLAWLYFKDHPLEYQRVEDTGDGFQQKAEVLRYLADHYPRFAIRTGMLKQVKTRKVEEPYRLLSAHVHSQSSPAVPKLLQLADVVAQDSIIADCIQIQSDVSEYIGDVLVGCYASEWASLPKEIIEPITRRVTDDQRPELFK
jgi:hypothetical protein